MKMSNEEIQNLYSLANYVSIHVSPTDGRRIERAAEHIEFFQRMVSLAKDNLIETNNNLDELVEEYEQTKEA